MATDSIQLNSTTDGNGGPAEVGEGGPGAGDARLVNQVPMSVK
jgi:hypothetical protein